MRYLILLCCFLTACAHTTAKRSYDGATLKKYNEQREKRRLLSGDGSLSLVSSRHNGAAALVLQAAWPAVMRMELQNPVGGKELLLFFSKELLFADNPHDPQAFLVDRSKAGSAAAVADLLPFPLGGQDPLRLWQDILFAQVSDRRGLELDAATGDLLEWRIEQTAASPSMLVSYESYKEVQGVRIPHLVRAEITSGPHKDSRLVLRWRDVRPEANVEYLRPRAEDWSGRSLKKLP